MIISSRMATARCPCRARGTGPVKEETRLQLRRLGAAIFPTPAPSAHNALRATGSTARGEDERRLQLCAGGPARDPRAPPLSPWRRGPRGSAKMEPLPPTLPIFSGVFGRRYSLVL